MSSKTLVMVGMVVGSIIGGWVPTLFGADWLSFASIIGNGIGGILGIFIFYRLFVD